MTEATVQEYAGGPVELYEELTEIERRFEDVEVDLRMLMGVFIIEYYHNFKGLPVSFSYIPRSNSPLTSFLDNNTVRQNYILTRSIFADRAKLIEKVPHFWAIVFEEATEEIDRFIQPCDTDALNTLQTLHVSRFDISFDAPGVGEPRSVKLTFTFGENSWFEDRVLEKKFWYRLSRTGYTGLVSEPVRIRWKKGKDLTEGLLDESCRLFEIETDIKKFERHPEEGHDTAQKLNELKASRHALVEKLEHRLKSTQQDAISFFAWFGYRGRNVSAEESAGVVQTEIHRRKHRKGRNENGSADNVMLDDHEAESAASKVPLVIDTSELDHEIFPAGEELAVAISDDLYPGAVKYFSQLFTLDPRISIISDKYTAQSREKDAVEYSDEEEDEDGASESESESSVASNAPATKKLKTST